MFLEFFSLITQGENAEFLLLKQMSYSDTKSRGRHKTKIMQLIFTMTVSSLAMLWCFHDSCLVPKPKEYSQNNLL